MFYRPYWSVMMVSPLAKTWYARDNPHSQKHVKTSRQHNHVTKKTLKISIIFLNQNKKLYKKISNYNY